MGDAEGKNGTAETFVIPLAAASVCRSSRSETIVVSYSPLGSIDTGSSAGGLLFSFSLTNSFSFTDPGLRMLAKSNMLSSSVPSPSPPKSSSSIGGGGFDSPLPKLNVRLNSDVDRSSPEESDTREL